jgi:lysyl-tRNA synthetase, class I
MHALDKLRERYTLTAEQLADILFASPLFADERRTLIFEGISAYYNGDHVKAVHLLGPQIEHAMRMLLVFLGIPASKPARAIVGTMQVKNLGDILWEPRIVEFVPEDLRLYLTAFLVDPRGHNLRNRLL